MERNLPALAAQLTLEEKAGLCAGADFWQTKGIKRLGIPALLFSDGPHGMRTHDRQKEDPQGCVPGVCFPTGGAAAASFDTALLRRMGAALGRQARALGVGVLLGPAVNIKRSPLCGRNFEYFSEDPCLAGELAVGYIEGVQSQGVGACVKHFAANSQEYRRMSCSSDMTERTLREIYLPAFETAVKRAQPWTVMCSYNRVNGVYASENRTLLTDILREEWGFQGAVVSDWGAVADRVKGADAGLDLEMPGPGKINGARLATAVRDGTLPEEVLDRAVVRILELVLRTQDRRAEQNASSIDFAADHAVAAELEKECAVLLQNRGALPLRRGSRVAYIGGFAEAPCFQGGGSSHVAVTRVDSALETAKRRGRRVKYVRGFPADRDQRDEAEFLRAVSAAADADAAVIFAGLPEGQEAEGFDRAHMRLPDSQNNLIARVAAVQKNTIVVLHTGAPVECPWADDVAAVLCMYLGGEGVGIAADALLWGEANPSGRLPETWPLRLEDTPAYLDFPGDGRHVSFREGVYVGYRWYDARRMPVRWPFGHGLSYTGFVYREPGLTAAEFSEGETVRVRISVKNVGMRTGREVVQLYVSDCTGTVGRPPRELRRFVKIKLDPGEEKQVEFSLNARDLSYYEEAIGDWYAPSGEYLISLGHSSRDIHAALRLRYTASRRLPFAVDENTALGDLAADDRTAPLLRKFLEDFSGAMTGGQRLGGEALLQEMGDMPLRGLVSFCGPAAAEKLEPLLAALRAAVQPCALQK